MQQQQQVAQGDNQNHSAEQVLSLYETLRSGASRQIKDQANGQILHFLNSTQSWAIASQILESEGVSSPQQFIGAQILYKKIETKFDDLTSDAQVLEVRDNLLNLVVKVSQAGPAQDAQQQGPVKLNQRVVVDRLCMCLGLVALNTVNTCWTSSVADIIAFGSENTHKCYLALLILKALAEQIETQHWDRQQKQQIEVCVREGLDKVLAFICQILQTRGQGQLPNECYFEALKAAKGWCAYSKGTFVPNQEFIQHVFHMMENDRECFSKAISVVKKLLVESKFVKALEYNSMEQAFSMIPEIDKSFLQGLVMYCGRLRDNFVTETQKPFNEEDDEDQPFARKFCGLVTVICSCYELLLIQPSEESSMLFTLMKDAAKSQNQRITTQSLDFWCDFYETLRDRLGDLSQYGHLFTHYREVSQLLLLSAQKLPNIAYDTLEIEEIQELEVSERGIDVGTFRENIADILLKTYFLQCKAYSQEGANQVFQLLLGLLQEGLQDPYKAEVAFFGARSLLDGIEEDNLHQDTISFFSSLIDYFVNNPAARDNYIVAKSVILFIDQAAKIFQEFKQHTPAIVSYLFNIFTRHPKLQSQVVQTLLEYSLYCKHQFTSDVVSAIHTFISQQYNTLSLPLAQKLVETLAMVISVIDTGNFSTNLRTVTSMPMQQLVQGVSGNETDRNDLLKAVTLLTATTKAIDDLPASDLIPVLMPLFNEVWPYLCQILQNRSNDNGLVDVCCEYLNRMARALKTEMTPCFSVVQQQLLQTFQVSQKNFKCLETVSVLMKCLGQQNTQMRDEICGSFEALCQMILPKTMKQNLKAGVEDTFANRVDTDVVTQFANLLYSILQINAEVFLTSSCFDECLTFFAQAIGQINQAEMLKAIVNLMLIVIQSVTRASAASQQRALAHYNNLVISLMAATAQDRGYPSIIPKVAECLVSVFSQVDMLGQLEGLRTALNSSFEQCALLQALEPSAKTSFVYAVMVLREEPIKVQLALKTLNWNVTGQNTANDFLGLEIAAKNKEDKMRKAATQGNAEPEVIHI